VFPQLESRNELPSVYSLNAPLPRRLTEEPLPNQASGSTLPTLRRFIQILRNRLARKNGIDLLAYRYQHEYFSGSLDRHATSR
jgi:hypothetical protein